MEELDFHGRSSRQFRQRSQIFLRNDLSLLYSTVRFIQSTTIFFKERQHNFREIAIFILSSDVPSGPPQDSCILVLFSLFSQRHLPFLFKASLRTGSRLVLERASRVQSRVSGTSRERSGDERVHGSLVDSRSMESCSDTSSSSKTGCFAANNMPTESSFFEDFRYCGEKLFTRASPTQK